LTGIINNYDEETSEAVRVFMIKAKAIDAAIMEYGGGKIPTDAQSSRITDCIIDAAHMIARFSNPPVSIVIPERLH
jgi:hypothetical protein